MQEIAHLLGGEIQLIPQNMLSRGILATQYIAEGGVGELVPAPCSIEGALYGEVLVLWNGRFPYLDKLGIIHAARLKGMCVLFMEYGLWGANEEILQADPTGVNADSSASRIPALRFANHPCDPAIWDSVFPQAKIQTPEGAAELPFDRDEIPEPYIFFPGQLYKDTHLLHHSPRFPLRTEDAYGEVLAALPAGYRLVVKEHPWAVSHEETEELMERYPEVVFCRWRAASDILSRASACVTVNSTVGLQALCRRMPTVVLGNALYARPEWCEMVFSGSDTASAIQRALTRPMDWDLCGRFLTWLRDEWHLRYSAEALVQRMRAAHSGSLPWMASLG
jgi:hypothetical protein